MAGQPLRVLLVEDNPLDAELVLHALRKAGFAPQVRRAEAESTYLAALEEQPEIILADYNLPGFDAPRALALLQQRELDIPFIVVTGAASEEAVVACMRQGAADYLLKDRLSRLAPAVERALAEQRLRRERLQAQAESLQRARELSAAFAALADGVMVYDVEGHRVHENRAVRTLFGLDLDPDYDSLPLRQRAARLPFFDEHGLFLAFEQRPVARVLRGETLSAADAALLRVQTLDGRLVEVEASGSPIRDGDGAITGAVLVYRDVSERRRLERQVVAERDRLQQVLDELPEAVSIVDADGQIVLANRVAREILEVDITGSRIPVTERDADNTYGSRRLDGTPYPFSETPLQRSLLRGELVHGDQQLIRQAISGRDVPVLISSAPLRDRAGAIVGAVAVFQDITALRNLEQARDEFLSSVSHDLKTPLTSIRGLAQLLQRQLAREDAPHLQRAVRNTEMLLISVGTMTRLIDDLLDVTKLRMGQQPLLERRPTDLVALVRGVVERQRAATPSPLDVQTEAAVVMVECDGPAIERVLGNLLGNAIKYSPEGGRVLVRLATELRDGESPALKDFPALKDRRRKAEPLKGAELLQGRVVVLSVQDHGVGIPSADLPNIFERFYRGANVVGRIQGTGVGLASAQHLVTAHGGTIEVESIEGVGTTFTVRLPLQPDTLG